jgi:hypothetical protein
MINYFKDSYFIVLEQGFPTFFILCPPKLKNENLFPPKKELCLIWVRVNKFDLGGSNFWQKLIFRTVNNSEYCLKIYKSIFRLFCGLIVSENNTLLNPKITGVPPANLLRHPGWEPLY